MGKKKVKKAVKKKKQKIAKIDGMGPREIAIIRNANRKIWYQSSYARKLCVKRSIGPDGFPFCEKCKKTVPKNYIDHIVRVGNVDSGFLKRLWCSSKGLQALCKQCHDAKTKEENQDAKDEKILKSIGA